MVLLTLAMAASVLAVVGPAAAQDQPTCGGLAVTILGTSGDDVLTGTDGIDVISGLEGNDIIRGLRGRDVLCGGPGRDRIFGGRNGDIIFGGDEGDKINGEAGADILLGERGNDRIIGGGGDDSIDGGRGRRDRLFGREGVDSCVDAQSRTIRRDCESTGANAGQLGSTLDLTAGGVAASWTVHSVADPATPSDNDTPGAGNRFVSIQVATVATAGNISDCTFNVVRLIGSDGAEYVSDFIEVAEGLQLDCYSHAPGDVRQGWVTFEVPQGVQPDRVRVAMDAGFSPDQGTFDLTAGTATSASRLSTPGAVSLGDSADLTNLGDVLRVTVHAVADPATPVLPLEPGERIVAARVSIENRSDVVQFSAQFSAIGTVGQIHRSSLLPVVEGPVGSLGGIQPGETITAWVSFVVPDTNDILKIEASHGLDDPTAEWAIAPQ
jgi:hypothetical protein